MEQKPIRDKGVGRTFEALREIRQRLSGRLDLLKGSFGELNDWLQAPVSPTGKADSLCEQRAQSLAPQLSKVKAYTPNMGPAKFGDTSNRKKWELINAALAKLNAVVLKGAPQDVGGPRSVFSDKGHHVILLLGKVGEKDCYIGFDPDISATEDSRRAWDDLLRRHNTSNVTVKDLQPDAICDIVRTMILGGGQCVGPLIRKYYPNVDEPFRKIDHGI